LAWHVEAFRRSKKLPSLKSLMLKDKPRAQSWQEQQIVMQKFATAHNATIEGKRS